MKLTHINKFIAALAVAMVSINTVSFNASANEAEDFFTRHTLARYFQTQVTARSLGLGGSYAALKDGTLGIVGNPATLSALESPELSFSYQFEQVSGDLPGTFTAVDEDIHRGLILGAMPVLEDWTIGIGAVPSSGELDDTDDRETENLQIPFGVAYQLNDAFSVGYGITYIDDEVDSNVFNAENEEAFLHRLGLLYDASSELSFGLVGSIGHGDMEGSTVNTAVSNGELESWGIRAGVAWQVRPEWLLVGDIAYEDMNSDGVTNFLGLAIPFDEDIEVLSIQGGAEYMLSETIDLRTGVGYTDVEYDNIEPALSALVGGSDWVHWSGGASYMFCENASADAAVQIRFLDEVDVLAGVTVKVTF